MGVCAGSTGQNISENEKKRTRQGVVRVPPASLWFLSVGILKGVQACFSGGWILKALVNLLEVELEGRRETGMPPSPP